MALVDNSHVVLTFHRVVFAIYLFSVYYDLKYTFPPPGTRDHLARETLGGRFKFLTFINAAVIIPLYFAVSIINDYFGTNSEQASKRSFAQKFRDFFFTTIVFPIGVFGSSIFWGLYAIDRDLIYSKSHETWMPLWLNHVYHTLTVVVVLIELLLVNHTFQRGLRKYVPIFVCYLMYTGWVFYVVYKIDFWIYSVFEVLSLPKRLLFIAFLGLPPLLYVYIGEKLHKLIWGRSKGTKQGASTDKSKKFTNKNETGDPKQAKGKGKSKKNKETKPEKSNKKKPVENAKPVQKTNKNKKEAILKEKPQNVKKRTGDSIKTNNKTKNEGVSKQGKSQNQNKSNKKKK